MKTFDEIYTEDASTEKIALGSIGRHGEIRLQTAQGNESVTVLANTGELTVGGTNVSGDIILKSAAGNDIVTIHANNGELSLGGKDIAGNLILINSSGYKTATLDANKAKLELGYAVATPGTPAAPPTKRAVDIGEFEFSGQSGEIILYNGTVKKGLTDYEKVETVHISGDAYLALGGVNHSGSIALKDKEAKDVITLNGDNCTIRFGGGSSAGKLEIQSKYGASALDFDGETGKLILGADLVPGTLILNHIGSKGTISLSGDSGNITLGGNSRNGSISVKNSNDKETIWIDGDAGDITFRNADFAEEFDICPDALSTVEPGMVMVLGDEGGLAPCNRAYDSRVAGIVCGAGGYKPGIVMDNAGRANRLPVAVMGKVFCRVDASKKPVRTGDLLTTSRSRGHAMRAEPGRKSFGSIVGKALSPLASGQGLVPVLVSLQ